MTPMIDVVFQMIIFFVCTVQLEKEAINEAIKIPDAPHAPAVAQERDPRTITIEMDKRGKISIARTPLTVTRLKSILKKTVADYGVRGPSIPILIRADSATKHLEVRRVMDACTSAGLYKIAIVAVKDSVQDSEGQKSEGQRSKVGGKG